MAPVLCVVSVVAMVTLYLKSWSKTEELKMRAAAQKPAGQVWLMSSLLVQSDETETDRFLLLWLARRRRKRMRRGIHLLPVQPVSWVSEAVCVTASRWAEMAVWSERSENRLIYWLNEPLVSDQPETDVTFRSDLLLNHPSHWSESSWGDETLIHSSVYTKSCDWSLPSN